MCRNVDRRGMQVRCEYMVSSVRTNIFMLAGQEARKLANTAAEFDMHMQVVEEIL